MNTDSTEKTTMSWKEFLNLAQYNFDKGELDLAQAYAAGALNMPLDDEPSKLEIYKLLYKVFGQKGDEEKMKQYLSACMAIEPQNHEYALDWYQKCEKQYLSECDPQEHTISAPVDSFTGNFVPAPGEEGFEYEIEPDWFMFVENEDPKDVMFALKMVTDNMKNYIEFPGEENKHFLVSRKMCEKLGIPPTDLFLKDHAVERRQFIKMQ